MPNKLAKLKKWHRSTTMADILYALRQEIINALRKNITQPDISQTY